MTVFRRINGHIVPIKISQTNKDRAKAAGAIGTGIGAAILAGKHSSRIMFEAAKLEDLSRDIKKIGLKSGPMFMIRSDKMVQNAFRIRSAAIVATAGLLGYAAHKIINQTKYKKHKKLNASIIGTTTAAATFGVYHQYLRGVGTTGFKAIKMAFKRAAKIP